MGEELLLKSIFDKAGYKIAYGMITFWEKQYMYMEWKIILNYYLLNDGIHIFM